MLRPYALALTFLIAIATLAPVNAQEEEFCTSLKKIMADRPNDFKNTATDKPYPRPPGKLHRPREFVPRIALPGLGISLPDEECTVSYAGGPEYGCHSWHHTIAERNTKFDTLRNKIARCLAAPGKQTKSRLPGNDGSLVETTTWQGTYNTSVEIEQYYPSSSARDPAVANDIVGFLIK